MVSKQQQKRTALHEKLQQLRSVTNSTATDSTAIIDDASIHIEELMEKVEKLNLEIQRESTPSSSSNPDRSTMEVEVETVEKGFKITVYSRKNYHGLLLSILNAFNNLGLDVLDATSSCSEGFSLEALAVKVSTPQLNLGYLLPSLFRMKTKAVIKEALLHAMKTSWNAQN